MHLVIRKLSDLQKKILKPAVFVLHKKLGLSPNQISVMSFLCGMISVIFMYLRNSWLAMLFMAVALFFDGCDGVTAKLYNLETELGKKLELFFDKTIEFFMLIALVLINEITLKLALLTFFAIILVAILREKTKFDIGFKRTSLFFGYAFGFNIIITIVFFLQLSAFVIQLAILHQKHQKKVGKM